jgi:glutamyl-tRNA synthetase
VLRIEDIDSPRIKPGATEQAMSDLTWLGLDWDDGPFIQSQRIDLYESALTQLRERELVYPCTCSRSDVEQAASAPHAEHEGPLYPGTCAGRQSAEADRLQGVPYSWRFRTDSSVCDFLDRFHGRQRIALSSIGGDFVVWKSAGTPAYQLAVVLDDAALGITEVVRGDDLLPSTPRQLLLYEALGLTAPDFVHVPLVVGPDGRRLAKRHGDTRLASLRAAGVTAEAVVGLLAWSCGWIDSIRPTTPGELLPRFRLLNIPKHPFMLEPSLLERIGFR